MHWSHVAGMSETRWVCWLLVFAGVMGIAAGVIVLAEPAISLITLAVISGIFCVADGIAAAVASLAGDTDARLLSVFAAIVGILIGVILIRHPIAGIVALGVLLGLWLIAAGVIRLAWIVGGRLTRAWWWVLVAVIEIAAGIVIISSPRIAVTTLPCWSGSRSSSAASRSPPPAGSSSSLRPRPTRPPQGGPLRQRDRLLPGGAL